MASSIRPVTGSIEVTRSRFIVWVYARGVFFYIEWWLLATVSQNGYLFFLPIISNFSGNGFAATKALPSKIDD